MQQGRLRCFLLQFFGALLVVFFTVEHVRTGDFVVSTAHQTEFNLVLDVFDMKGTTARAGAHQGSNNALCQFVHGLADAGRGRALGAMHGQEGLHHGDGDLCGFERYDRTVASDDLVLVECARNWVEVTHRALRRCGAGVDWRRGVQS